MERLRHLRARYLAADPQRVDLVLAAVLAVLSAVEALLVPVGSGNRVVGVVAAVLAAAAVSQRRRHAVLSAALVTAPLIAQHLLGGRLLDHASLPFVVLIFMSFSLARHWEGRRRVVALVTLIVVFFVAITTSETESLGQSAFAFVLFGPPILAGVTLRRRAQLQAELLARTERLAAQEGVRAERAVGEERARIAGELQAVVANGVSAMVVQAQGVPRVLEKGDTAAAEEALLTIEETGRDALAEMRRLLGVLRREGERPALAPMPSLSQVDSLLASVREDGLEAELSVEGEPAELPSGVDLAAYRVLQGALESAGRGGGASRAEVTVRYAPRRLDLRVSDDRGAEGPDGELLAALRERVDVYGGRLSEGRRDGAYVLEASLPVAEGAR